MPYTSEGVPFSEPTTSRIAARMLTPERRNSLRYLIRNHLARCSEYGSTCEEAEDTLGLEHETCSARFRELELDGWAIKTVRQRQTHTGELANVYMIGQGIPIVVPPRVPKNIDWSAKPLGPFDYKILMTMIVHPRRCKVIEHLLPEHDHEAISGNLRHLVERNMVEKCGCEINTETRRPAIVWRLTGYGRAVLRQRSIQQFLDKNW